MATELWAIGLVIIAGLIGGLGPIYLKKGSGKIKINKISTIYKNPFLIIGVLIYGVSAVIFIPALKGGELSVLYPLVGLAYVWVSIYSIFMLKEKMNLLKWIGIIAIIIGVSFIGFGA
jgi:uncharacterized membrane protein